MSAPHDPPTPPSTPSGTRAFTTRHAWYAVAILTIANVCGFVDRQILSLLVGPIRRDLGVSDTEVSVLMGLGFVAFYSVLGLPIGRLVDRGPRRVIVAAGTALWSVMTSLTAFGRTYGQIFAARIGVGVGEATLGPAAISIIGDAFPQAKLGMAMSTYMLGTFFGSGVAYALGAWVVGALDRPGLVTLPIVGAIHPWQTVFLIVGLPGLIVAGLALTMVEPPRAEQNGSGTPRGRAGNREGASISEVLAYVRQHRRTVIGLSLGFAFSASVNYGIAAWLATFFVRTHGWSIERAGTLQGALTMTVGVLGTLLGGRLTDVWAKRGISDAPLRVGMMAAAGMLVFAGLYPVVSSATLAAVLLVPVNLFAAMPWGAASAAVAETMPSDMRGQGGALFQLVVNLVSGAVGPTAVALVTDHVFHEDAALRWSLMLCTVAGMTVTLALLGWARPAFRATLAELAAPTPPASGRA